MKNISKKLKKLKKLANKKDEPHPNISNDILDSLVELENKLWKKFIKWGIEAVDARIENRDPDLPGFVRNGYLVYPNVA